MHAAGPIVDRGVVEVLPALARGPRPHVRGGAEVDISERLDKCLGVAGRQSRRGLGLFAQVAVAAAEDLVRLALGTEPEFVWVLLAPFERALGSEDPDAQVVLVADLDLGSGEDPASAALEAEQEVGVIV